MPERSTNRHTTVDMHCHLLNPAVEALVAATPQKLAEPAAQRATLGTQSWEHNRFLARTCWQARLTDLDLRLADMDAMGIDIQAVSPAPNQYYYWADEDLAQRIVKVTNEAMAAAVEQQSGRMVGLGTIALQFPELAAEQAVSGVKALGLRGFEISSLVNGVDLADAKLEPFWRVIEELGVFLFLHPLGSSLGSRLDSFYLSNIIGQPLETTIALSKLIFSGVLDRYPRLKICAAHGGGFLPFYSGRSDHAYAVRPEACGCSHPPSAYLRRIWFDTVVYRSVDIATLVEAVGPDRLVLGTDYPYDMGENDPVTLVKSVEGISEQEQAMILGRNALDLLGIPHQNGNLL